MGTHPIFESDFDCLTDNHEIAAMAMPFGETWSKLQMHKTAPVAPDERPEISKFMSEEQREQMAYIKRGHLGIPEDILRAGATQYSNMCNGVNNKFMLCKQENHGDPRPCLKMGSAVSDCAAEFFEAAITHCRDALFTYSSCLDRDVHRFPGYCRGAQQIWDHCAYNKLNLDKDYWAMRPAPVVHGAPEKPLNPLGLKETVAVNDPAYKDFSK